MATLTVWKFDTAEGAEERRARPWRSSPRQELITIHDAATVSWEAGKKKPKTRQLRNLTGAGALGGAFWGLLFGLIFFVPLLGAGDRRRDRCAGRLARRRRHRRQLHQPGCGTRSRRGPRRCS